MGVACSCQQQAPEEKDTNTEEVVVNQKVTEETLKRLPAPEVDVQGGDAASPTTEATDAASPGCMSSAVDEAADSPTALDAPSATDEAALLAADVATETHQERMRAALFKDGFRPDVVEGSLPRRPSTVGISWEAYTTKHEPDFARIRAMESTAGWELKREDSGVKTYTKQVQGVSSLYFKCESDFRIDKGLAHFLAVLLNADERPKWDDVCVTGKTLQHFPPYYKRSLIRMKTPMSLIAPRELLTEGRMCFEEDGSILIALQSVDSPDAPETPQYVRAHFVEGGYIIRPKPGSDREITLMWAGCVDPKGWLPAWISNLAVAKQGLNLLKLKQATS